MRLRIAGAGAMAALLLMLVGCGSGTNITAGNSVYGSYAGIYRVVNGAAIEEGTLTLVIGRDGGTAGTLLENTTAATRTLVGTVTDRGRLEGTLTYPSGTFTVWGDLALVGGTNLVGVLQRRDASGHAAGTFTVDCVLQ